MPEVGVLAVVNGLQQFLGDMRSVNSAIDGLRPSGTMIGSIFESVGEAISNFGQKVWDVASVTLGILLRDAILAIIDLLKRMASAVFEAGSEFQILQLRLQRLNFNTLIESGMEFNQATEESIRLTKEQLDWLTQLAALSPYDASDIANVFTLARSYGFASEAAQRMTRNVVDFAAGMGLGNLEMQRIIINFGQLVQQGKLNSQELRDLARGSFVPINEILTRMAKNMGISVDKLNDMRKAGEGGAEMVTGFMEAFNQLVEERFVGASEKMSRTFKYAVANLKDLLQGVLGFRVVTPILDVLGSKIAGFVEGFTKTDAMWNNLTNRASEIGGTLAKIVDEVVGKFLPDTEKLADNILNAMHGLSQWLMDNKDNIVGFFTNVADKIKNEIVPFVVDKLLPALWSIVTWVWDHRGDIMGFFEGIATFISETLVPFVEDRLMPAFDTISTWFGENQGLIDLFLQTVGEVISTIATDLLGAAPGAEEGGLKGFLKDVQYVMGWFIVHHEEIAKFAETLIKIGLAIQVILFAFNLLVGILVGVWNALVPVITIAAVVLTVLGVLTAAIMGTIGAVGLLPAAIAIAIGVAVGIVIANWEAIKGWFKQAIADVGTFIAGLGDRIVTGIRNIDWPGVGLSIMSGIANGITFNAWMVVQAATNAAVNAYNAALTFLQGGSPSKLFEEMGAYTMVGFAQGIDKYAGLARASMVNAVSKVSMPAMSAPFMVQALASQGAGNTIDSSSHRNYNLTVHSSADNEPIIQDFNMMESLAG